MWNIITSSLKGLHRIICYIKFSIGTKVNPFKNILHCLKHAQCNLLFLFQILVLRMRLNKLYLLPIFSFSFSCRASFDFFYIWRIPKGFNEDGRSPWKEDWSGQCKQTMRGGTQSPIQALPLLLDHLFLSRTEFHLLLSIFSLEQGLISKPLPCFSNVF